MILLRAIVFTAAILATTTLAHADKRVALVIGNAAYKNVTRLQNPANDAAAVVGMFKQAGFDSVDTRLDLTGPEMRRALREFGAKTRDASVAVIYYAGHGIELDGTNYLIPVDATLETDTDVYDETFALERVLVAVEPAKQLRLVILDACRDNPFAKKMKRTVGSRAIGRGLAKVEPSSPNTMIAFAAKAGSTASDGDSKNSPFAAALVDHLAKPGLDLRKAFGFVRDDVLKATNNAQEPFVYGSLGGNDVALVPAVAVAPAAAAPADQDTPMRRDYELAERVGNRTRVGRLHREISVRFLHRAGQGPSRQTGSGRRARRGHQQGQGRAGRTGAARCRGRQGRRTSQGRRTGQSGRESSPCGRSGEESRRGQGCGSRTRQDRRIGQGRGKGS